jgi:hypothetical protein
MQHGMTAPCPIGSVCIGSGLAVLVPGRAAHLAMCTGGEARGGTDA